MSNSSDPFVSVIIVNYNYAHLITRALDAIKAQTFKDFEIVIVNNGSTDNSDEVVNSYIADNPTLRIITARVEKNVGLYKGRNTGLDHAHGRYVLFNDADDWMEPTCLEVLYNLAKNEQADKVSAAFMEVDTDGNHLRTVTYCENQSKWFSVSMQATIFSQKIIKDHKIRFHESWLDDIDFNTQINYYAKKVCFDNTPVYDYYVNQMSTSGAKVKNRSWTYLDLQRDMLTFFVPMIDTLDGQDKKDLYYLMIKQYYFYLLHSNRYSTWPEMKKNYTEAHEMMLSFLPDYLKGHRVSLFKDNGDRVSGRRITWLFYTAEKTHTFKALLRLFLFASKFKYLNP